MIPDPSPPFEVSIVGAAQQNIIELLARSLDFELRADVERLLSVVDQELRLRPRTWGDPIRNYPNAETVQYRGKAGFLYAYYSVHDRLPWVFLTAVTAPKGHPLSPDNS